MVKEINPIAVYAGDTVVFPQIHFLQADHAGYDFDDQGWSNWRAYWEGPVSGTKSKIPLEVDDSGSAEGRFIVTADAATTRAMRGNGTWDLQAERGDEVRTWLRGKTIYTKDVTP